jgi:ribitol-5-phosphate 2-dehydrogenase (NADP+) / D-ribitol-5-phosphate cytidylyltransferase
MTDATHGRLRTVAVILGGGTGSRVGLNIPKQLIKVSGTTILEHTLRVFQDTPEVDEIVLTSPEAFLDDARRLSAPMSKVKHVIPGGATRNDTSRAALDVLGDEECKVLYHDAVRPFVDRRIIVDCIDALDRFEAVDVAIPAADTIIEVDGDQLITDIPTRARMRRGQTPQGFLLSTIRSAYQYALADPAFSASDDCGVVLKYLPEVPIYAVAGTEQNMKVTHPIDVFVVDRLFQLASSAPPASLTVDDYRRQLEGRTVVVLGGSYGIGAEVAGLCRGLGADVFVHSRGTGCHVERYEDVVRALDDAAAATGRVDYVVLTAAVLHKARLADTSRDVIEESLRVNFLAPVTVAQVALPHLTRTGGGLVLYTSSSYTRGRAEYSLYSSTKAAVVNLTQALADEWSSLGVRVNCINPERAATPMRTKAFGEEPPETLLSAAAVARSSLDVMLSGLTGQVVDVRRITPGSASESATEREAQLIEAALAEVDRADSTNV